MGKKRLIFMDKAGNKLFRKEIKTRGTVEYSAKNRQGKLVNERNVITLLKRSKLLR